MNTREKNLDLLRVIAAFLVVMLHTSVRPTVTNIMSGTISFTIANFFNAATRVAVPIFVLLSGAFLLENEKNKDFYSFYKKTCSKIILPTFIASLIYMYYSDILNYMQSIISHTQMSESLKLNPLYVLRGPCFYHLWYMYMLIGLYMMVPLLIRLKARLSMKHFTYIGIILLAIDMVLIYYNEGFWPTRFINYLGYFILGYVLHHHYYHNQHKKYALFMVIAIACYLVNVLATEFIVRNGYFSSINKKLVLYGNLSPLVIIGAICLFAYFVNLPPKDSKLLIFTPHTFNIYLVHAGILKPIDQLINNILKLSIPTMIYIPIITIVVFLLSYEMSILINFITKKIKAYYKYHTKNCYNIN